MKIALDSNVLTYFTHGYSENFSPVHPYDFLTRETIAIVQVFFYFEGETVILPSVESEYGKIEEVQKRLLHDRRVTIFFSEEKWLNSCSQIVQKRAGELFIKHGHKNDCIVLAEAELAKIDFLLSCDSELIKHFNQKENPKVILPGTFIKDNFSGEKIVPRIFPAPENPLSQKTWWLLKNFQFYEMKKR